MINLYMSRKLQLVTKMQATTLAHKVMNNLSKHKNNHLTHKHIQLIKNNHLAHKNAQLFIKIQTIPELKKNVLSSKHKQSLWLTGTDLKMKKIFNEFCCLPSTNQQMKSQNYIKCLHCSINFSLYKSEGLGSKTEK